MFVSILHEIDLTFSVPITESALDFRMAPRSDLDQTLRNFKVIIAPETPVSDYIDWQENRVHHASIRGSHDRIIICGKSTVDVHPRRWRLEEMDDSVPIVKLDHRCQDFLLPNGPVQFDPRLEQFIRETGLASETSLSKVLSAAMLSLTHQVVFKQNEPYCGINVPDVLTRGQGGAEDCAHVALSLLRLLGIPARYVSGYLFGRGDIEYDTHAWVDAFVPSVGWVGFDPTLGQLIGDSHIAIAIGRSHSDVPLQRVVFRGDASQDTGVRIRIQNTQKDCYGELSRVHGVRDRQRIDLMLKDRSLRADSLEQQTLQ